MDHHSIALAHPVELVHSLWPLSDGSREPRLRATASYCGTLAAVGKSSGAARFSVFKSHLSQRRGP